MNNLITNQPLTMSSRELAEYTGKQHQHIKRDIEKMLIELELDVSKFGRIYKDSMNRSQTEYLLDRDQTDCLLTGYSAKARMKVIKRWKELEAKQAPQIPQSFAEALQLAADQAKQLELAAPKVEFHDTVIQSDHTYKMQEAGKKIQQRPNMFIKWLRGDHAIQKGKDKFVRYIDKHNVPMQRYIDQGLFKLSTEVNSFGYEYTQGRVTTKGLSYFTEKLSGIKL